MIRRLVISGFVKNTSLPQGLTMDDNGVISGTPTAMSAAADYNIVVKRPDGTEFTTTINLEVVNEQSTITTIGTPTVFSTCAGTASLAQTFSVSGVHLTAGITLTAPTGFEISLGGTSYTSTLTIAQTSGNVSATSFYVRLKSDAITGVSGSIVCSSTSATNQTVNVSGTVNALPIFSYTSPQNFTLLQAITTVSANNTGTVSIASFSINTTLPSGLSFSSVGDITGTPTSLSTSTNYNITGTTSAGCTAIRTLNLTVANPPPALTVVGTPTLLSTCNGIASSTQSFTIAGQYLGSNSISVTAPTGFEISRSSNSGFSNSLSITPTAGTVLATSIYVRLSTTALAGNFSATIVCANTGAVSKNIAVTGLVKSTPTMPVIDNITAICVGGNINITAATIAGATYAWTGPNNFVSTVQNPSISAATVANGGVYNLRTTLNGCISALASKTAIVNATPVITGNTTICGIGNTTTLVGTGSPDLFYGWTSSNTAIATINSSGFVAGLASGIVTIDYLNADGCTNSTNLVVSGSTLEFSNALNFDGDNDYVTMPSATYFTNNIFTIEAWVNPKSFVNVSRIIDIGNGPSSNNVILVLSGQTTGHPRFVAFNGTMPSIDISSSVALPLNTWSHIAITSGGYGVGMFINGVLVGSTGPGIVNSVVRANNYIGKSNWVGDGYADAKFDEIRIWNVMRTQGDIIAAKDNELVGNEAGLLAYYKFNQGVANGTNTGLTSLVNNTGNATYNATLNNFYLSGSNSNWINGQSSIAPITGTNSVCLGTNVSLSDATVGGVWSSDNLGIATVNSSTGLVNSISTGSANIKYTLTNGQGCSNSASTTFTVQPMPRIASQFNTTAQSKCIGTSANAFTVATSTGSGTISTYQWYSNVSNSTTGGTLAATHTSSSLTDSYTPSTAIAGTLYYYVIVTNTNGCSVTSALSGAVVVNASPSITGTLTICKNGTTQLSGTGTPANTGAWITGNGAVATVSSTGLVTGVSNGTGLITYTNIGGCTASTTIVVEATSVGGTVSGGTTVCIGTNSTLLTLNNQVGSITKWQSAANDAFTSATDIVNTSATYTVTNLTSNTYFRAVVTSGSCSSANSAYAIITVNPTSLGGTIAGSATICSGTNSSTIVLSGNTGTILNWQSSTLSSFSNPINITNATNTFVANSLTATTYYRAIVKSGVCNAVNSATATITVNRLPIVTISQGTSLALGAVGGIKLNATASVTSGGTPITYQWFNNSNVISGANLNSYSVPSAGKYSVKATDSRGCYNTSTVTEIANIPTLTSSSANNFCAGGSVEFSFDASAYPTNLYSITWQYTPTPVGLFWFDIADLEVVNGGTAAMQKYTATAAGSYQIKVVQLSNPSSPQYTLQQRVQVFANPVISITNTPMSIAGNVTLCQGNELQLASIVSSNALGNALNFESSRSNAISFTDYVVPRTGDFSLEFWVKSSSNGSAQQFLSQGSSADAFGMGINTDRTLNAGTGWSNVGYNLPANEWVHLAIVKEGTNATIYANGTSVATKSNYSISSAGDFFAIGQYANSNYFNGTMDELRVWNVARTQAEIESNKYKVFSGKESGIINFYDFNQGVAGELNLHNDLSDIFTKSIYDYAVVAKPGTLSTSFVLNGANSNYISNDLAFIKYDWTTSGNVITEANLSNYSTGAEGAYQLKATDQNGCVGTSSTTTLIVNPLPTVIVNSPFICQGQSATITAIPSSANNTPSYQYAWSVPAGVATPTSVASFTASIAGNYNLIVSDGTCISNSVTSLLTVNPLPALAAITGVANTYIGGVQQLTETATGGKWAISNNAIAVVNATGLVTGVSSGATSITYRKVDANGCENTVSRNFIIGTPIIYASRTSLQNFSACYELPSNEQSFTIDGTSIADDLNITAPVGYELSVSSGSGFQPSLSLKATNGIILQTIYVRVNNSAISGATGNIICTSTYANTVTITTGIATVNALPTISIGQVQKIATNTTAYQLPFTATTGNPNQYTLSAGTIPMSGFTALNNVAITTTPLIVSIPQSVAGSYGFDLVVKNSTNGCMSIVNDYIVTVMDPEISFSKYFDPFITCAGIPSAAQRFTISGSYLTSAITVAAPVGYELSIDNATFSNTIQIVNSGTLSNVNVYVRINSTALNNATGNIAIAALGIAAQYITMGNAMVDAMSIGGTISFNQTEVCIGSEVIGSLIGQVGTIDWQSSIDNQRWISMGSTIASVDAKNLQSTTYFRVMSKSGVCEAISSNTKEVVVNPLSSGGIATGSSEVCNGLNNNNFALTNSVGAVTKWQSSIDGIIFNDIANSASLNYASTDLMNTVFYRAVVKSGVCDIDYSTVSTVFVKPDNTIVINAVPFADAQTVTNKTIINNIVYNTTGANGVVVTGLPVGVTSNWISNTIVIKDTPIQIGRYNYVASLSGGCGTIRASGIITVLPENPSPINGVFTAGASTNPNSIAATVNNIPTGAVAEYCDINVANCTIIAPVIPIKSGKYIWAVRNLDTLNTLYSISFKYDTITVLPSPIVTYGGTFMINNPMNPANIEPTINNSLPFGIVPVYCDVNGANCSSTIPLLPTANGLHYWRIWAYDTLNDLYSATYTMDTVKIYPNNPQTANGTYYVNGLYNPINLKPLVLGTNIKYYIGNSTNGLTTSPTLATSPGVYSYYATQTQNGQESDPVPFYTTILKSPIDLLKTAGKPKLMENSSFDVDFKIVAINNTTSKIDSVLIEDNLSNVFPIFSNFSIIEKNVFGNLVLNNAYDGSSNLNINKSNNTMLPSDIDSAILKLNYKPNNFSGDLFNTAIVTAKGIYGWFRQNSTDPSQVSNSVVPTKFSIPKIDLIIPNGFSPNNDGIDDKFIIVRPYGTNVNLTIVNRWGNVVFNSDNYNNDWDGKGKSSLLGQDLQEGTYYYSVIATSLSGISQRFSGYIMLAR